MFFSLDLKSTYKSLWIGWLLITWTTDDVTWWPREVEIAWRPE